MILKSQPVRTLMLVRKEVAVEKTKHATKNFKELKKYVDELKDKSKILDRFMKGEINQEDKEYEIIKEYVDKGNKYVQQGLKLLLIDSSPIVLFFKSIIFKAAKYYSIALPFPMVTDGVRIIINPFLMGVICELDSKHYKGSNANGSNPVNYSIFTILHEAFHIGLMHCTTLRYDPELDQKLMNYAADLAVNSLIEKHTNIIPSMDVLMPDLFDLPPLLSLEQYLSHLLSMKAKTDKQYAVQTDENANSGTVQSGGSGSSCDNPSPGNSKSSSGQNDCDDNQNTSTTSESSNNAKENNKSQNDEGDKNEKSDEDVYEEMKKNATEGLEEAKIGAIFKKSLKKIAETIEKYKTGNSNELDELSEEKRKELVSELNKIMKETSDKNDIEVDKDKLEEMKWEIVKSYMSSKQRGDLPAGLDLKIEEWFKPVKSFKEYFEEFLVQIFDFDEYSYSKPDLFMKTLKNIYFPSLRRSQNILPNVAISIDTSGSTLQFVNKFISFLKEHLIELKPITAHILYHDAAVSNCQVFQTGLDDAEYYEFRPSGGGGTSHVPVWKYIDEELIEKGEKVELIICLTDGYTEFGEGPKDKSIPIFWIIFENKNLMKIEDREEAIEKWKKNIPFYTKVLAICEDDFSK